MRAYLAILAALTAQPAWAQSADDIISKLKPNAAQLSGPTRGIRRLPAADAPASEPAAPGTPRHHAAASHAAAADAPAPSVKLVIDFKTGSADLDPRTTKTLDALGTALSSPSLASFRFRVEGHTDTVGSPAVNQDLSQRRAQTVATYLETKFSIAEARLQPVGVGSSQLIVPTPAQTPEPRNRRVVVVNLGS